MFSSCLPTFLVHWIDVNSNFCVSTAIQLAKFPHVHLVTSGWYLDFSRGFVHEVEAMFYNNLISSAIEAIELEEEPKKNNLAPPSNEK